MIKRSTLVLAGGGHTHALLLKRIQQNTLPNTRLILISTTRHTPYSGMLPGVISGHYTPEQAHIDLRQLASDSGCEFVEGSVSQLDSDAQIITTDQGENIPYDYLSINTGSTQTKLMDANHCLTIKPVHRFLHWLHHELPDRLNSHEPPFELMIVGAGAAGIETSMALKHRYNKKKINIHIISGSRILPGYPDNIQTMVQKELIKKGISVHQNFRVASIENQQLISDDNHRLPYHQLILATSASPAPWPSESQLTTDARGFILVNDHLQSISHPNVFAAGDIATMVNTDMVSKDMAKCGVYAVRQAPTLYTNLYNILSGKPLKPFHPQQQFLALLSCADGRAIASRNWFRAKGRMVWYWKDSIDRKFMDQFPSPDPDSFN